MKYNSTPLIYKTFLAVSFGRIGGFNVNRNRYIFKQTEAEMKPLTAKDLQITALSIKDSASGMDQWAPGDITLLSPMAFEALATMLNKIESGGGLAQGA